METPEHPGDVAVGKIRESQQRWRRDMAQSLSGKKIAILATDGVEQSELQEPYKALKQEGATVEVVSPKSGDIQSMVMDGKFGEKIKVDRTLAEARPKITTPSTCRA